MADDNKERAMAEIIADQIADALARKKAGDDLVAAVELRKDVDQHKKDLAGLQTVVYKEHEPVVIWARNFMDSYRKIVTAVVISALITLAGFLMQMYYLLQKAK
jgi:hypothetical protein